MEKHTQSWASQKELIWISGPWLRTALPAGTHSASASPLSPEGGNRSSYWNVVFFFFFFFNTRWRTECRSQETVNLLYKLLEGFRNALKLLWNFESEIVRFWITVITYINKSPTWWKLCCLIYFTAKSLYMFRVSQHLSSAVLKSVTAASGTGHNIVGRN